jgi:hypothetical protein
VRPIVTTWSKCGVAVPAGGTGWRTSHAALPVVEHVDDRGCRLYVTARDEDGRSRIGRVDVDLEGRRPPEWSDAPLIDVGPPGSFDESGATGSCAVPVDGRIFQYYTGWTRGVTVPFYFYAGLAISDDEGRSFRKVSAAPILERNAIDPYLTASPWVLHESGVWRMWYVSGLEWSAGADRIQHRYHIRYAESHDGVAWKRDGRVCIDFSSDGEYAFGRPCVVRDGSRYRMWYSVRGAAYRIGYAESPDGLRWERLDHLAGIEPSASGWDAGMIEYPVVFEWRGRPAMLYNGDGFGKTGIGLAVGADSREAAGDA